MVRKFLVYKTIVRSTSANRQKVVVYHGVSVSCELKNFLGDVFVMVLRSQWPWESHFDFFFQNACKNTVQSTQLCTLKVLTAFSTSYVRHRLNIPLR